MSLERLKELISSNAFEVDVKGRVLNSRWVEILMNLPVGWVMPSCDKLNQVADYERNDNRTDELRMLGNGVVPATAAKAFHTLAK